MCLQVPDTFLLPKDEEITKTALKQYMAAQEHWLFSTNPWHHIKIFHNRNQNQKYNFFKKNPRKEEKAFWCSQKKFVGSNYYIDFSELSPKGQQKAEKRLYWTYFVNVKVKHKQFACHLALQSRCSRNNLSKFSGDRCLASPVIGKC